MGINHIYIPPHEQSLNEAEKVCDQMWAVARTLIHLTDCPSHLFALAVDYAMTVDLRMATTASRGWLTPYEMIKGVPPSVTHLRPFYTRTAVRVPVARRKKLESEGEVTSRAELGRFVGFQGPFSTTPAIMLSNNRLVHNINVTFDVSNYNEQQPIDAAIPGGAGPVMDELRIAVKGSQSNQENSSQAARDPDRDPDRDPVRDPDRDPDRDRDTDQRSQSGNLESNQGSQASPQASEYYEWDCDNSPAWETHAGEPQPRPRPRYTFLTEIDQLDSLGHDMAVYDAQLDMAIRKFEKLSSGSNDDVAVHLAASEHLALMAQKDMNWRDTINGPGRDKAIDALENELSSLQKTILTELTEDSPDFELAVREATPGRLLLDIKRDGSYKVRGVKQGFRENKEKADGVDFNYYAHVAKLVSIRAALFRHNRGNRRLALKDIRTAFLQADSYPDGQKKYICFKHPLSGQWMYYRQSGPIYGEASAPVRWEDTVAPWFEEQGFVRGENERSVFYHPERDLLLLLYVDDCLCDGMEDDINWLFDLMDQRFECKPAEWLAPDQPLDYIGMEVEMDNDRIYLSMRKYIEQTLKLLDMEHCKTAPSPIISPIETDSPELDHRLRRKFMTAVGCLGWLVNTARPDVAYAHSRISQHMAKPTESAWEAVQRVYQYLKGAKDYCLSAKLNADEQPISMARDPKSQDPNSRWENYCDSDFAGNAEEQNRRRSQNGWISLSAGAPVDYASKVTSIAFAHPDIGEAHADTSSGAAEIYCAANATFEMLHLSYIIEEMGMTFQHPIILQMDNTTAEAFINNTAWKSKLKHIDARQNWVRTIRNKGILKPLHVNTKVNKADIFTKILPTSTFLKLRDMIMYKRHRSI
jgi:hypothetical protein